MAGRRPLGATNGRLSMAGPALRSSKSAGAAAPTTPGARGSSGASGGGGGGGGGGGAGGSRRYSQAPQSGGRRQTMGGRRQTMGLHHGPVAVWSGKVMDKAEQRKKIQLVMAYMDAHNFPHVLTESALRSPSSRVFFDMLELLVSPIDDQFAIDNPEVDVPALFARLKYPLPVAKNLLKTVGTPHGWPHLLAALAWLTDLMSAEHVLECDPELAGQAPGADAEHAMYMPFFEKVSHDYLEFLARGTTEFPMWEEELRGVFLARDADVLDAVAGAKALRDQAVAELEALQAQPNELRVLRDRKATYESDASKFKELIEQLDHHLGLLREKVEILGADKEASTARLAERRTEREELIRVVSTQKLTAIDVERITTERARLQEQLDAVARDRDAAEATTCDAQIALEKTTEDVQRMATAFNSTGRELGIIPVTAKHANGRVFEVKPHATEPDALVAHLKENVQTGLAAARASAAQATRDASADCATAADHLQRATDDAEDKGDEIADLERKLRIAKDQARQEKDHIKAALAAKEEEAQRIIADAAAARERASTDLKKSQDDLALARQRHQKLLADLAAEEDAIHGDILQTLEELSQRRAEIRTNLTNAIKFLQQTKTTVLADPTA